MSELLVICGAQKDFFQEPFGNPKAVKILPKMIEYVNTWDGDIIAVKETRFTADQIEDLLPYGSASVPAWNNSREHLAFGYPEHCIKFSDGWEILPGLLKVLQSKNRTRCKFRTVEAYGQTWHDWANNLDGYDSITVIGTKLEDQVISTVFAIMAVKPEAMIIVPSLMCCSEFTSDYEKTLSVLREKVIVY